MRRRFVAQDLADVFGCCGDHGFDHETCLRHANRNRCLSRWGDRNTYANAKDLRIFRVALMLVCNDEALRIHEAVNISHRRHTPEGRQHHGVFHGQLMRLLDRAILVDLFHDHLSGFDLFHAGIGDPLDVAFSQLAFEQALGVAHAIEAEMTDIGL